MQVYITVSDRVFPVAESHVCHTTSRRQLLLSLFSGSASNISLPTCVLVENFAAYICVCPFHVFFKLKATLNNFFMLCVAHLCIRQLPSPADMRAVEFTPPNDYPNIHEIYLN